MRHERRARLLLLVGSVLAFGVAALGVELALRWVRPASLASAPALQPHVYSPAYGWRLRKGFFGLTRDGRTVRTNRLGFRGPEPALSRTGRRRVLLLGDSLTFGTGVDEGETFAARLGERSPAFEPLNLGVSGYGTDQELLLLEAEGWALAPGAVVLNVCVGNDILDNALPVYLYDGVTPKPYFAAREGRLDLHTAHVRLSGPALLARRLTERSLALDALLALVGGPGRAPLDHDDGEHWGPRARAVFTRWGEAEAITRLILARLEEACRKRGVRLLVLLHPNRNAFAGDDSWANALKRPGRDGVRVIDLREVYRARGLGWGDFALDKLGHLNPRGHQIVAEVLARALAD